MGSPDFYVDAERVMEVDDIRVLVTGDSRIDMLPPTRDISEEIPGLDGEIDFGTEFRPRPFELDIAIELGEKTKDEVNRILARVFNPKTGIKTLLFADEPDKLYRVKYSGRMDLRGNNPTWLRYTIPFKMPDPYLIGATQKTLIGNGTATNTGNVDTPVIVGVAGESTSPSVAINGTTMQWNNTVDSGKELTIDTQKQTVVYDDENGLEHFNNEFLMLEPGGNTVSVGGGGVITLYWHDRWI